MEKQTRQRDAEKSEMEGRILAEMMMSGLEDLVADVAASSSLQQASLPDARIRTRSVSDATNEDEVLAAIAAAAADNQGAGKRLLAQAGSKLQEKVQQQVANVQQSSGGATTGSHEVGPRVPVGLAEAMAADGDDGISGERAILSAQVYAARWRRKTVQLQVGSMGLTLFQQGGG